MIDLQQSGQGLEGYELLAAQLEALLADERDVGAESHDRVCAIVERHLVNTAAATDAQPALHGVFD